MWWPEEFLALANPNGLRGQRGWNLHGAGRFSIGGRAGLAWGQMPRRPWASLGDQPSPALGRALAAEFSTSLKKAQMPLHAFLGDPKGAGQLPGGNG